MSEPRSAVRSAMDVLVRLGGVPAHSVWTEQSFVRTHHLELGSGRPLILLHGGTGGGANWFRLFAPLAPRFRVLAPDLPGFGLSDPITPTYPMGEAAAARLLAWLDTQGIQQALVVGTSFGGLAALRLAQLRPDRVRGLLLLDSAGLGSEIHPSVRLAAATPLAPLFMQPSRPGTHAVFRALLTTDVSDLKKAARVALVDYLYATAVVAGASYSALTLRLFSGSRGQREVLGDRELRALRVPITVMWGERDRLLPAQHGRRAAGLIPGAELRIVPAVGHSPNWEAPEAVLEAILRLAARTQAIT